MTSRMLLVTCLVSTALAVTGQLIPLIVFGSLLCLTLIMSLLR